MINTIDLIVAGFAAALLVAFAIVARWAYVLGFRSGGDELADAWANEGLPECAARSDGLDAWPAAPARERRPQ